MDSSKSIQSFIHISLFSISSFMSILMFILIANSPATKIALALLALIFELTKLTDLHKAQTISKWKIIYASSYGLKAILSVIASVGLILTLLSAQDYASSANNQLVQRDMSAYEDEVTYWDDELQKLDETVSLLNENLDRNPEGYGIASKAFVRQIESLQNRKEEYHEKYSTAVNDQLNKLSEISEATIIVNPADMFIEIGSLFGIDPGKLRMIVFVAIMGLVELSLALTGIAPDKENKTALKSTSADTPEKTESSSTNPNVMNQEMTQSSDLIQIPPKELKASLAIANQQSLREKRGAKLMTQAELAEKLGTSSIIINNMVRRYVKPIMRDKGFKSFTELRGFLKTAC